VNTEKKETICIIIATIMLVAMFNYGLYTGTKSIRKWRVTVEKTRYTGLDWHTNLYITSTRGKCKVFGGPRDAIKRWDIQPGKTYIIYYAYYRGWPDVIVGVQEIG